MSIDNIHIAGRNSVGMPTEHVTRPFRWLLKRELWEHSVVRLVPLAAGAIVLIAMLLSMPHAYHEGMPAIAGQPSGLQRVMLGVLYAGIAQAVWTAMLLAALFYCLDALHAERRDRSILFWKSMPVSDLKTVLAKLTVPMLLMPLLALGVIVALEVIATLGLGLIAWFSGRSLNFVASAPLLPVTIMIAYALGVMTLWLAPVYGWLLLVSAWAKRGAFLWAVLPPLALLLLERVLGGTHAWSILVDRFLLRPTQAFQAWASDPLFGVSVRPDGFDMRGTFPHDIYSYMTPVEFLSTPGLWLGLACAAAFIAIALIVRRRRDVL